MPISFLEHRKDPARYRFDPVVSQAGLTITVAAGTFLLAGEEFVLAEDEHFTAEPDPVIPCYIEGVLVRDQNGAVRLFIDEVFKDGVDRPFNYAANKDYTFLAPIFDLLMPAGATTLDDVAIRVRKYVAPPPPPPPPKELQRDG